jgi:penicillin amidase
LVANSWSRGPFAVGGDNVTVNATAWAFDQPFAVTSIPAMRFIADVGNLDGTVLELPLGESGRPWSPHYADQIESWRNVATDRFVFTREMVEAGAVATLELVPPGVASSREETAP